MHYSKLPFEVQVAGVEVYRQREIIEASIERLIDMLDELDAPFEDIEDDGHDEDDGNGEAVMTTDGWSA